MTLPIGSPEWLGAWSGEQRDQTLALAARRERALNGWLGFATVGVLVGAVTVATGQPAIDGLPPAPTLPATLALVVDVAALGVSRAGWRAVTRVFTGQAPPAVLRTVRGRSAGAALVALLASLFGVLWGAVVPAVALTRGEFGWDDAGTALADLLALAAGIAAMRLWVNLLRVRVQP